VFWATTISTEVVPYLQLQSIQYWLFTEDGTWFESWVCVAPHMHALQLTAG